MAPDWEKLHEDFKNDKFGLVAEVDCTTEEEKPLCDANGVKSFPTLKYGDPSALEDYQGGRSYDNLLKFAKEHISSPVCSPANINLCEDEKKKKQIQDFMKLSTEELKELITAQEQTLEEAENVFKVKVQELQDAYQKLNTDKDATIAAVKESGLGIMKSVQNHLAKNKRASDEL
jgi:hypothetical protein